MSRPYNEQNTIEDLVSYRKVLIDSILSGDLNPETAIELNRVNVRLNEFSVDVGSLNDSRAAVKEVSDRYDVRVHGIGVRVTELNSGRTGVVESVRETAAEWIEPIVRWDDGELSRARWELILEESHG